MSEMNKRIATEATLQRVASALEAVVPGYEKYSAEYFDKLFSSMRTGKVYGTKIWKFASNPTSACEKTRDNTGLVCQPSTDTVEGKDDYADIPLFQWYECNYKRYDDGFAYPTAMLGDGAYQETGSVDCGSLQMTFYYKEIETEAYTELLISDSPNHALGLQPWCMAKRADGTVMPYFIQSRFFSGIASDGLLRSQPGLKPARDQSYSNMITNYQKKGKGYWGAGSNRMTFAQIFLAIKHAQKNVQKVFGGCTSYSVQLKASVESADKHKYFPVSVADKDKVKVGSYVSVGYAAASNLDRSVSTLHAYADDVLVTKVEKINDTTYGVYLDCDAFATAPVSGNSVYLTSMHYRAGATDAVIGHHDGSPVSNTDSGHPYRIQGIEYHVGGYQVASDTVMFFNADSPKDVYYAPRGTDHTTDETKIKNTYKKVGTIPNPDKNGTDFWIGDVGHSEGVWYPSAKGSGEAQGIGDMCWAGGSQTSGSREYLMAGSLGSGGYAGLSFLFCRSGLSGAGWYYLAAD